MKTGAMNHPARNPLEEIDWIGKNGFDFVDFTLEPPAADPDKIDPGAVRAALDCHGLGVVAHTAYYLRFATPFANVQAACLSEFRRALRAAREIGATVMNVRYGKAPGFFTKEQVIEWHVEVLSQLCQEAAAVGVAIVLEHIPFGQPLELCDGAGRAVDKPSTHHFPAKLPNSELVFANRLFAPDNIAWLITECHNVKLVGQASSPGLLDCKE